MGGVCGLANILGEEVCRLYELCKDGKIMEAKQLSLQLIKPCAIVSVVFGGFFFLNILYQVFLEWHSVFTPFPRILDLAPLETPP